MSVENVRMIFILVVGMLMRADAATGLFWQNIVSSVKELEDGYKGEVSFEFVLPHTEMNIQWIFDKFYRGDDNGATYFISVPMPANDHDQLTSSVTGTSRLGTLSLEWRGDDIFDEYTLNLKGDAADGSLSYTQRVLLNGWGVATWGPDRSMRLVNVNHKFPAQLFYNDGDAAPLEANFQVFIHEYSSMPRYTVSCSRYRYDRSERSQLIETRGRDSYLEGGIDIYVDNAEFEETGLFVEVELSISSPDEEKEGLYSCRLEFSSVEIVTTTEVLKATMETTAPDGLEHVDIDVTLEYKSEDGSGYDLEVGQPMLLICDRLSTVGGDLVMRHDGIPLENIPGEHHIESHTRGGFSWQYGKHIIPNVKPEDGGTYTCGSSASEIEDSLVVYPVDP